MKIQNKHSIFVMIFAEIMAYRWGVEAVVPPEDCPSYEYYESFTSVCGGIDEEYELRMAFCEKQDHIAYMDIEGFFEELMNFKFTKRSINGMAKEFVKSWFDSLGYDVEFEVKKLCYTDYEF